MREIYQTLLFLCLSISLGGNLLSGQDDRVVDLGFRVPDLDGETIVLRKNEQEQFSVVCFLGTECPLAKLYASRLNEIAADYPSTNFIAVFSNHQDSLEEVREYQKRQQLNFPIARDTSNIVADQFNASRTPEVFVLDNNLTIQYRGRIDDQYQPGIAKSAPNRHDLRIALDECLTGKPVSIPATEPEGCLIGRIKSGSDPKSYVTYANQISRLLQNHCFECHRKGEIGPMELTDYEEVSGWADMIAEVINENRMPPWHADPKHGEFLNERRMTSAEKQMFVDWVAAGLPIGDLSRLPPSREVPEISDWRLPREPDAVFEMRAKPFTIPAEGTVEYQYFVVDPKFKEDKWVTGAEIVPGDRTVLHHSIVFVRPPDGAEFRGIGWLAAYVPGQTAPTVDPKSGRRIPAGSKLVFQQHYTPAGTQTSDVTRIGLVFGDENEIENEVTTLIALDQEFVIPAEADNYQVSGNFRRLPKRGNLLALSPHMHNRGKSFRFTARTASAGPDQIEGTGTLPETTLLNVPDYDFNWQHIYQLKNPLPIEDIQSLGFVASFDNSKNNPANPDSQKPVMWGDQSWEEMAVGFIIVSEPRFVEKPQPTQRTEDQVAALKAYRALIDQKATTFTNEYFARWDANRDGKIVKSELARSIREFGRSQLDNDHDGIITRAEIHHNATIRFQSKVPMKEFDPDLEMK